MFKLNIVYQDESLLVIDKPVGVVVNRSITTKENTVQDYIEENFSLSIPQEAPVSEEIKEEEYEGDFLSRSGIVHRLDKDTSGLLIVALNDKVFKDLQSQFKAREIEKEYLALVHGRLEDEIIEINVPIQRDKINRFKLSASREGKEAFTRIQTEKIIHLGENVFTYIKAFPKTGRTHQIRVHMSAINHPVVNDPVYSTKKQQIEAEKFFDRMMLHAHGIKFKHPITGNIMSLTAPLPPQFKNLP